MNRLARTDWTQTASGFGTGHFVAYTYDALSRRTAVNDNWNATTAFAYDRADRLTAITAPSGKVTTLTFDPGNRPTKVKYPSGLESRLSYDIGAGTGGTGRLASIARGLTSTGATGSALNQLLGTTTYGYDARGDIVSQFEPARARSFTYDPVQRLTAVAQSPPTPAVNVEAYTLDLEGNRISSKSSAFYVTAPANRVIEDANAVYTYDVDGNQVTKTIKATGQQWRYTYDVYDRLLQAATYASAGASTPDRIITYAYDALDRRIQRSDATASASSPTAVETYIHDGWNTNAIEERTINFGSTIARRTWYTQAGTDDLVALTTWDQASGGPAAAGSAYYSTDHLGSVRALHDDTGTVVASYDHDTFGNPQTAVESTPQPFRFTGRDYDRVTGLYHYRTREYDPQAGRFLQEDQIWFNSGDFNVYRYVGSNPVSRRDPTGQAEAIEYACIASHATANGINAGASIGIELMGLYGSIANAVASATGYSQDVAGLNASFNYLTNVYEGLLIATDARAILCGTPPAACSFSPSKNSFGGETLVLTSSGLRRIDEVQVGDKVAAWHEAAVGGSVWRTVTGKSSRQVASALLLTLNDATGKSETIRVTPNHPFLVAANDNDSPRPSLVRLEPAGYWAAAGALQPGDHVKSATNELLTIAKAEIDGKSVRVYDLEVDADHVFAVGDNRAWVHNARGPAPFGPTPGALGPHSTLKIDPNGKILGSQEFWPNPCNPTGWQPGDRYRAVGKPHGGIPPPVIISPNGQGRPK